VNPWWNPPETHVATTKEGAIRLHRGKTRRNRGRATHALIYTDGSEISGEVGAAAWCPEAGRSKSRYMGDNATSTVYAAELVGIELAIQIAQELEGCTGATIFTDNQAAIQAVARPTVSSGQYITFRVIGEIEKARRKGIEVELQWVPSHQGVPGNEEVDKLAKQAAGWDQSSKAVEPEVRGHAYETYILRSAKKRRCKQRARENWNERWQTHQHGREYYRHTRSPNKTYLAAHGERKKALSSVIVQMRTGKIGLNSLLHGIRPSEHPTDRCRACTTQRESLHHVLVECLSYQTARQRYWVDGNPNSLREIFNDTQKTATAARLLLSLGLLSQFSKTDRRTLAAPEQEQR